MRSNAYDGRARLDDAHRVVGHSVGGDRTVEHEEGPAGVAAHGRELGWVSPQVCHLPGGCSRPRRESRYERTAEARRRSTTSARPARRCPRARRTVACQKASPLPVPPVAASAVKTSRYLRPVAGSTSAPLGSSMSWEPPSCTVATDMWCVIRVPTCTHDGAPVAGDVGGATLGGGAGGDGGAAWTMLAVPAHHAVRIAVTVNRTAVAFTPVPSFAALGRSRERLVAAASRRPPIRVRCAGRVRWRSWRRSNRGEPRRRRAIRSCRTSTGCRRRAAGCR